MYIILTMIEDNAVSCIPDDPTGCNENFSKDGVPEF
jgi:hypothetical protein